MKTSLGTLLAGLALAAMPATAFAEDDPAPYPDCTRQPTEGDTQAAKGAFAAGQAAYNEGDYERAITYWSDAYRRDCTAHALLRNLATAFELSGKRKAALLALETYLTRSGDTASSAQIQRKIDLLKQKIQEDEAAKTAPPPVGGPGPGPVTGDTTPGATGDTGGAGSGDGAKPITPLIVAGGGGLIATIGAIVWLGALGDVSDFEKQCPKRQCPSDKVKDEAESARGRAQLGGAITLIGAAVGVGGLVWYITSEPEKSAAAPGTTRRAHVAPAVGPGFAGLAVSGTF